ncbi:MAG: Rv3235 family protein [Actinomycetota bacterium]
MTVVEDLPRVRHHPLPDCLPPIDRTPVDDRLQRADHPQRKAEEPPRQGTFALFPDLPEPLAEDDFGPLRTPSSDLPDPKMWSHGLVQILIEVLTGHRRITQLMRWTTTDVFDDLRAKVLIPEKGKNDSTRRNQPRVLSIHVCEPTDSVAEVCAVARSQSRTRAIALRLEGADGRWLVTALETD